MFSDVIRTAETEHEIFFLLTSYAEAVRYDRPIQPLPELDAASKRLDDKAVALIKLALHTYGTALGRLQVLGKETPATAGPQAGTEIAGRSRAPLEILLVEDNPAHVRMTREALEVAGLPHRP